MQAENFFRWGGDGAQWMAGFGDYAYNELGWRTAVVIGDDYDFPCTQGAGFVAEFCALGGDVVQRLWPPLGEEDYTSYIAQIQEADGFLMNVTGSGTLAFARQYDELRRNLADKIVASTVSVDPNVLKELGDRVVGVVTAGPAAADSEDPMFQEYLAAMQEAYPDLPAGSLFDVLYYDAMEALLQALEQVDGDLSDDHAALRETLANLELDAPNGDTTLDENRNSVARTSCSRWSRTRPAFASPPFSRVEAVAFGDLFLEDVRAYREARLASGGKRGLFPLWGRDTGELAREFIAAGFEAIIVCLDPRILDPSFAGRPYDERLLAELPLSVDPCGENGEFHTFVHTGPIFSGPIACETGAIVERDGFVFCDLTPA